MKQMEPFREWMVAFPPRFFRLLPYPIPPSIDMGHLRLVQCRRFNLVIQGLRDVHEEIRILSPGEEGVGRMMGFEPDDGQRGKEEMMASVTAIPSAR